MTKPPLRLKVNGANYILDTPPVLDKTKCDTSCPFLWNATPDGLTPGRCWRFMRPLTPILPVGKYRACTPCLATLREPAEAEVEVELPPQPQPLQVPNSTVAVLGLDLEDDLV